MSTRRKFLATSVALPFVSSARPAHAQESTPATDEDVGDVIYDIVYSEEGGQPLTLDVYRPPWRERPRPAVILIHGGIWSTNTVDRNTMVLAAFGLMAEGYVAVNISYRLLGSASSPQSWPAQLDDVQRVVRWVREHAAEFNIDPERIGALGHSAGGHLAALLGVRETRDPLESSISSRVNCVVALAGLMDMAIPVPKLTYPEIVADLLGGTLEEAPDQYRDASPISWADGNSAPFLLLHGSDDTDVAVEHSRAMSHALQQRGVEVIYGEFPGMDHIEVFDWRVCGPWTMTFLARHLRPHR